MRQAQQNWRLFPCPVILEGLLTKKLKDKHFPLKSDEATGTNKDSLFIAYVCFVTSVTVWGFTVLRVRPEHSDSWWALRAASWLLPDRTWAEMGVCTDGVQTMGGERKGLQAQIKKASPNAQWTLCVIHKKVQLFSALCAAVLFHIEARLLSHIVFMNLRAQRGNPGVFCMCMKLQASLVMNNF